MPRGTGRGATQEAVRRHNLAEVLRTVHLRGRATRAELTAALGLNRSTIKALTTDLRLAGLVTEEQPDSTRRAAGRPSMVVVPREDVYVLAVHLGVHNVISARVGLGGRILDRVELRTDHAESQQEAVLRSVLESQRLLLRHAGTSGRCVGVAAAVCGVVNRGDGTARFVPNLGWRDVPLGDLLREEYGPRMPVDVRNEADLGALAEHSRGAAMGASDLVFVYADVGVGGGVILGDRAMTGHDGHAGEVGHLLVNPGGRRCRCGRVGCWETEVSAPALLGEAVTVTGGPLAEAVDAVMEHARAGRQPYRATVDRYAKWLAVGLGQLITLLNPETIVLGGVLADAFGHIETTVMEQLARFAMWPASEHVRIVPSALGPDVSLLGAAELAFTSLLTDPVAVLGDLERPTGLSPEREGGHDGSADAAGQVLVRAVDRGLAGP